MLARIATQLGSTVGCMSLNSQTVACALKFSYSFQGARKTCRKPLWPTLKLEILSPSHTIETLKHLKHLFTTHARRRVYIEVQTPNDT